MEDVVRVLGAPSLPFLHAFHVLSYSLRSRWAWDKFKEAVDNDTVMSPEVKTSVLKELHIV